MKEKNRKRNEFEDQHVQNLDLIAMLNSSSFITKRFMCIPRNCYEKFTSNFTSQPTDESAHLHEHFNFQKLHKRQQQQLHERSTFDFQLLFFTNSETEMEFD